MGCAWAAAPRAADVARSHAIVDAGADAGSAEARRFSSPRRATAAERAADDARGALGADVDADADAAAAAAAAAEEKTASGVLLDADAGAGAGTDAGGGRLIWLVAEGTGAAAEGAPVTPNAPSVPC